MNEKLQDLAWSVLPKEFKEEVKKYYRTLHEQYKDYDGLHFETAKAKVQERIVALQYFFGPHNLTSDAEGEADEVLTVSRKKVQKLYSYYCAERDNEEPGSNRSSLGGRIAILRELFGSKCLPDENSSNVEKLEKNEEVEPKPKSVAEISKEISDRVAKEIKTEFDKIEPKPAEPSTTTI